MVLVVVIVAGGDEGSGSSEGVKVRVADRFRLLPIEPVGEADVEEDVGEDVDEDEEEQVAGTIGKLVSGEAED